MKIKHDLVTNSSSASFIMTFEMIKKCSKEDFRDNLKKLMDYITSEIKDSDELKKAIPHFWNPADVYQSGEKCFEISEFTSMYNSYLDIPYYMRQILILSKIDNDLSTYNIESVSFRIDDDQFDDDYFDDDFKF